jgi:hypothetical protein
LTAAALVIAADLGIEPTQENVSRILSIMVEKIAPAVEAELKR